MRGQILGVDARTGEALVAGEDGRRYTFREEDWAQRGEPAIGLTVDFQADDRHARDVFPLPVATPADAAILAEPRGDRSRVVAAVLAFFLGTLGIHRFYLGQNGSAVVMLVMTFTMLGSLVTVPWALIDAVRYLLMSEREFAGRYPRY